MSVLSEESDLTHHSNSSETTARIGKTNSFEGVGGNLYIIQARTSKPLILFWGVGRKNSNFKIFGEVITTLPPIGRPYIQLIF